MSAATAVSTEDITPIAPGSALVCSNRFSTAGSDRSGRGTVALVHLGCSGQVRSCAWRPLRVEVLPLTAEPWVSVDDIALHLGVAKDSVYRWIERKGLPAHKMGRLWKFKVSEVDEWVRQGGAAPDADRDEEEHG